MSTNFDREASTFLARCTAPAPFQSRDCRNAPAALGHARVKLLVCLFFLSVACKPKSAPITETCTKDTPLVASVPGSPGHLIRSERHPDGSSELATLMRHMEAELRAAGDDLRNGRAPKRGFLPSFAKIRCSWPTSASDRDPPFDDFAVAYLRAVERYDAAPSKGSLNGVVGACQACHEQSCPGPLSAIEKLSL